MSPIISNEWIHQLNYENRFVYKICFDTTWIFRTVTFLVTKTFCIVRKWNHKTYRCVQSSSDYPISNLFKIHLGWQKNINTNLYICIQCMYMHIHCVYALRTLWDPMDCSPPGSSVHGIFQARILEQAAISTSGYLPEPGIKFTSLASPALAGKFFTTVPLGYIHKIFKLATPFFYINDMSKITKMVYSIFSCVEPLQIHLISCPKFTFQNRCGRNLCIHITFFSSINSSYHLLY